MTRILIVRLGALGDIVHAIPVAAAIRDAEPGVRIDWLVSAKHREILDLVTVVNERLVVKDRGSARNGLSLVSAVGALRRARYDVAVDLQGLIKSAALARSTGARRVVGFSRRYCREPLARAFYTDAYDPGRGGMFATTETRHVVHINLALLEVLGIRAGVPQFPLADSGSNSVADEMLRRTGGPFVLLNPGAAWPNKRWPPDRLAGVATALQARRGLRSVVLWGPGERALAEQVVEGSAGAAVLAPETRIADIVALTRRARLMISGDTGPAHIGAAVGVPIVGLYGPTRPERNGPWIREDVTVSRASICQCHHLRSCRLQTMCLLDIQVEEVVQAAERRLDTGRHE